MELAENVVDVPLGRAFRDDQLIGDLAVTPAAHSQLNDLAFATRELVQRVIEHHVRGPFARAPERLLFETQINRLFHCQGSSFGMSCH